jgi:hypothetical protein
MATKTKSNSQKANNESQTTTDHDEIRKWIESRGGKPATVRGTASGDEEAGLLRVDMPGGASSPPLDPVSWEEFFKKFDEERLAFLFQEETADGQQSHFCKFVKR